MTDRKRSHFYSTTEPDVLWNLLNKQANNISKEYCLSHIKKLLFTSVNLSFIRFSSVLGFVIVALRVWSLLVNGGQSV